MDFGAVVHVTHGDHAAEGLRRRGARQVRVWRDLLTAGRCDPDPDLHRRARAEQWGVPAESWESYEATLGGLDREQVVIWTSSSWSDHLYTWCLLDTLTRMGASSWPVRIARPLSDEPSRSLGAIAPARLEEAFARALPLDDGLVKEGGALWRKYVDPSPIAFDEARRLGTPGFPDLASSAEGHLAWFPWRAPDGRLSLADADAALFDWVGAHWSTRTELVGPSRRGGIQGVLNWIGDACVVRRLADWRDRGAVEMLGSWEVPGSFSVRVTPAGTRLREQGAAKVQEMAPLWVGGCRVNDPAAPWVRVAAGQGSTISAG